MKPIPLQFSLESNLLFFYDLLVKDVAMFGKLHHRLEKQLIIYSSNHIFS